MKSVLVILSLLIGLNLKAQSDTSDTSMYHYRISIKGITNKCGSNLIQEPLTELFKTVPIFQECIETFVFESKEDIEQVEIETLLGQTVTYFKKEKLK